jgi:hypothetical protein
VGVDPEFRRRWRLNWLWCLNEFSDIDLQRRMWLDPANRNPHWSYVEIMCSYFDDVIGERTYAALVAEGLISAEEATVVSVLHTLLDSHEAPGGDDWNAVRLLADPAWQAIVTEAKKANRRLAEYLVDPAEKDALLVPYFPVPQTPKP